MADLPDFYKTAMSWSRREWAAQKYELKSWGIQINSTAGGGYGDDLYTIPSGKRFYVSHIGVTSEVRLFNWWKANEVIFLAGDALDGFVSSVRDFATPVPIEAGKTLRYGGWNDDIIDGRIWIFLNGFETEASKPKEPESDDPEENYKLGNFNWVNIIKQTNGESLILFSKKGDDKVSYLRVRDFYRPNQKKLASSHLKPEHAREILSSLHTEPHKVKEMLKKYETHRIKA